MGDKSYSMDELWMDSQRPTLLGNPAESPPPPSRVKRGIEDPRMLLSDTTMSVSRRPILV